MMSGAISEDKNEDTSNEKEDADIAVSAASSAAVTSVAEKKKVSPRESTTSSKQNINEIHGNEKSTTSKHLTRLSRNNEYVPPMDDKTINSRVKEDISSAKKGRYWYFLDGWLDLCLQLDPFRKKCADFCCFCNLAL